MSQGHKCNCPRIGYKVVTRKANYSAFNGYRHTPSDYSHVICTCCGASWRTKAKWVDRAKDLTDAEHKAWLANRLTGVCPHRKKPA